MTNKIREFRARDGLTQEDLAHRVGVTRQTIIAIEKGNYVPSLALGMHI
ncbi:MAG: helix-turn-helix transcriptional regulator, partial [Patescibacteria group bacterium]